MAHIYFQDSIYKISKEYLLIIFILQRFTQESIPIKKNLCTPMFVEALFTKSKIWKQLKCPSVNEWIKKLVYLHNGILHSRKK